MDKAKRRKELQKLLEELEPETSSVETILSAIDETAALLQDVSVKMKKILDTKAPNDKPITIANFPPYPTKQKVEVLNQPDKQKVEVLNFPQAKEVQKVEITNKDKTKDYSPLFKTVTLAIKGIADQVGEAIKSVFEGGIEIKNSKKQPMYVMHVDEKGAPIGRQEVQVFGGGGGSSYKAPESMKAGKLTVTSAGTAEPVSPTPYKSRRITITALNTNQGNVWVGDQFVSAVDSIGIPLIPSQSYEFEINSLDKVFIDSEYSGDGISYLSFS